MSVVSQIGDLYHSSQLGIAPKGPNGLIFIDIVSHTIKGPGQGLNWHFSRLAE